ncbi:MAG: flippase [gamma proteobacterium symbiont of Taylorina sp.]|nr:flippase [gamma proteobacterium symbiont of Taylorina sp.]
MWSNGFKKYFSNMSWLALERFFRLGLALIIGVLVARYLGPESFGEISFALSLIGLFTGFSTLGLNSLVVKELVEEPDNFNKILGCTFFLRLTGALLSFIIISALAQLPWIDTDKNIIYIMALMAFFQATNNVDMFFQAKSENKYIVWVKLFQTTVVVLSRIYLLYIEADLIYFAWVYLLDAVILAAGLLLIYRKYGHHPFFSWEWDKSLGFSLLKNAWPLILSMLMVSFYMKIDQVMLQYFIGLPAVGVYAAASRLTEATYFLPLIIATALFPAILNAKKISAKLYKSRIKNLYSLMFVFAMLIIFPVVVLSDYIIIFLYGQAFTLATDVLKIHIWICIFMFWGVVLNRWILAENLQKTAFYFQFAGMITNIILNIFLIPRFGVTGAAWATLISQITVNLCYPALFGRNFRLQIWYQITSINFFQRLYKIKVL